MTENNFSIPYIVYESSEAKHERTVKRLITLLAVTIFLMFATNIFWMLIFCSYDYAGTDTETTVEAAYGTANYIGQDGDITYGTNNSENKDKDTNT